MGFASDPDGHFGMLVAHPHAVATADATLGHYIRLSFEDADSLSRTLAHAVIAHPAAILDGLDYR